GVRRAIHAFDLPPRPHGDVVNQPPVLVMLGGPEYGLQGAPRQYAVQLPVRVQHDGEVRPELFRQVIDALLVALRLQRRTRWLLGNGLEPDVRGDGAALTLLLGPH